MYDQFKPEYTPLLVEVTLESGAVGFKVKDEPKTNYLYSDTVLEKWGFPTTIPFKETVELSYLKNRLFSDIEVDKKWFGLVKSEKAVANCKTHLHYLVCDTNEKLIDTRRLVHEWEQICYEMLCVKLKELQQ